MVMVNEGNGLSTSISNEFVNTTSCSTYRMLAAVYEDQREVDRAKQAFAEVGYVRLPNLFGRRYATRLRREVERLTPHRIARNFTMPGYDTPRRLSVISGRTLSEVSPFLRAMSQDSRLTSFIAAIADTTVLPCTDPTEWSVINLLEQAGSTHGWHVDDPPLALVVIFEAPPEQVGGLLEYVPNWTLRCEEKNIDPRGNIGRSFEVLGSSAQVRSMHHKRGDTYLLRADKCLHRVTPLTAPGYRRVVLNLAFETSHTRYGGEAALLYDGGTE